MLPSRRWLKPAGILAIAGLGWWLFGWSTGYAPDGKMTFHRFFGRVTRIDCNVLVQGRICRERILFPWSEPWERGDPITSCAAIMPETWQDRNGDGKWDTWIRRVGPNPAGECEVEYNVDTRSSGHPDWTFVLPFGQYKKADAMIAERRGF